MKPRIFRATDGTWRVRWRYPSLFLGSDYYWERKCYTWGIACEQLARLYAMGDVG